MAGETISPNMNLVIPAVGVTDWLDAAPDINTSLTLIDQHNHASGNGIAISPPGLDINEDLSFQSNDAVDLRSTRFTSQLSPISDPSDLGCLYVAGVDLYYNDENGNQIRITASGGVAGTPGSIGNLTPPASVTYVSATPAFVFQSDANTSANLDAGSVTIRENVANAKGVTLSSPISLANDYTITFPGALPGANKIVRLDASGNLSATLGVDGSTIVISSNNLSVGTITNSQIANDSIDGDKITDGTIIALSKLHADPQFAGTFGISGQDSFQTAGSTYTIGSNATNDFVIAFSGIGTGKGYRTLAGQINGTTGGTTTGEGFTSSRSATGHYTITLTTASTNSLIVPVASALQNNFANRSVKCFGTSTSAFDVYISDKTDAAVDTDFYFHVTVSA